MGFGQGLSGLSAASQNLDVIGNDIANSQTVGYKGSSVAFSDVYASSQVGLGVNVGSVVQDYSSGDIESTGGEYDVAIDGTGEGFFVLQDSSGNVYYTRNGQFNINANSELVNTSNGMQVMGYPANSTNTGVEAGADLVPITISQSNMLPVATTSATVTANLNANATAYGTNGVGSVILTDTTSNTSATYYYKTDSSGNTYLYSDAAATTPVTTTDTLKDSAGTDYTITNTTTGELSASIPNSVATAVPNTFDPTKTSTYTNVTNTTIYDSLGNSHTLNEYFVKAASSGGNSVYNVYYTLDGNAMTVGSSGAASQQLTFNSAGTLISPTSDVTVNYTFPAGSASPAQALSIAMNYSGGNVTQYGSSFSATVTANGNASGSYTGVTVSDNGDLVAHYSNGLTQIVGAIALARFSNNAGLEAESGNVWAATQASGQATTGQPGTGSFASLTGQSLEESNVNLSTSLVDLIIAQRTYQANAQTIKTQDTVLQTLLNMS